MLQVGTGAWNVHFFVSNESTDALETASTLQVPPLAVLCVLCDASALLASVG